MVNQHLEEVFTVKAMGVACAAILVLLPAVALKWNDGMDLAPVPTRAVALADTPPAIPVADRSPVVAEPIATTPAADVAGASPFPAGWAKGPVLAEAVAKAMAGFSGHYSVVVQELGSGQRWELDANRRYHPASTIKMPVTLYALEQYRAGKLGWQELIPYTPADFESPGGGAFETAPFGGKYPVENLVNRALMYSNNVAVNMLGRYLDWDKIRSWSRTIQGELYAGEDGRPEVTALSELGWWLHLNQVAEQDPKSAELLLSPLRQVAYDGRIAAGLPKGVKYLHKFGSYDGNFHDGGIIYVDKPYVLVVMTGGGGESEADAAIARVSAAVYAVMTAPDGLKRLP